jgi:hypothetical protein
MKYVFLLFLFFGKFSSAQSAPATLIKKLIEGFQKGSVQDIKSLAAAENFYLKDSSHEKNSYTLVFVNKQKEAIGIKAAASKPIMVSYFVANKEDYNNVKAEVIELGYVADKPFQDEGMGIIEETFMVKENVLVIASLRKGKTGELQYDFIVTPKF